MTFDAEMESLVSEALAAVESQPEAPQSSEREHDSKIH